MIAVLRGNEITMLRAYLDHTTSLKVKCRIMKLNVAHKR